MNPYLFAALYLYAGASVWVQYVTAKKPSPLEKLSALAAVVFLVCVSIVWPVVVPSFLYDLYTVFKARGDSDTPQE